MSDLDFSALPIDIYSNEISSYATLQELFSRRLLSRADYNAYRRHIAGMSSELPIAMKEIGWGSAGYPIFADWLRFHLTEVFFDFAPETIWVFLFHLKPDLFPGLVEVALSFPEIEQPFLEYADMVLSGVEAKFDISELGPQEYLWTFEEEKEGMFELATVQPYAKRTAFLRFRAGYFQSLVFLFFHYARRYRELRMILDSLKEGAITLPLSLINAELNKLVIDPIIPDPVFDNYFKELKNYPYVDPNS